jgi:GNAT superfamily N-acetyltransferase
MSRTNTIAPHRRVLVVANETVDSARLHETILASVGDADAVDAEVVVVAPALNDRLRHWLSDDDGARRTAESRLGNAVESLGDAGVAATGWVGDADPLQAIDDALCFFAADTLIIATHPEPQSHWLARNLVDRARDRFAGTIIHVQVETLSSESALHFRPDNALARVEVRRRRGGGGRFLPEAIRRPKAIRRRRAQALRWW